MEKKRPYKNQTDNFKGNYSPRKGKTHDTYTIAEMHNYIKKKKTRLEQMSRTLKKREEISDKYAVIVALYKIEFEKTEALLEKMKKRLVKKEKDLGIHKPNKYFNSDDLINDKDFNNEDFNQLAGDVDGRNKEKEEEGIL